MNLLTSPLTRGVLLAAMSISLIALGACDSGGSKPDPDPVDANTAASMRDRINDFRDTSGQEELSNSTALAGIAQAQADYNADHSINSDTNGAGDTIAEQMTAEGYAFSTVAYLFNNLGETASFDEWKTNPAYNNILLDESFSDFGVGVATQGNGTRRWVVIFAATDAPTSGTVQEMLDLLNDFRTGESAGEFTINDNLAIVAQAQAEHNASVELNEAATGGVGLEDQIADTGFTYATLMWTLSSGGPEDSLTRWTDTQSEHDLLLDPRFTDIGIGVASGGTKQWWVVVYAEPTP